MSDLKSAVSFLTTIKIGKNNHLSPGSIAYFCFIGLIEGLITGGVYVMFAKITTRLISSCLSLGANFALTGMLHYDGLADLSDTLFKPGDIEKKLKILKDPHRGSFAIAVVSLTVILKVALVANIGPHLVTILLFGAITAISMSIAALLMVSTKAVGNNSLLSELKSANHSITVLTSLIMLGLGCILIYFYAVKIPGINSIGLTAAIAGTTALSGFGINLYSKKALGAIRGDALGASIVISEIVGLLFAGFRYA
jgi:adenosylcobinamide-GDP ribazoletransferase